LGPNLVRSPSESRGNFRVPLGNFRVPLARHLPALIFLVTFVAFLPSLAGQFLNWDDDRNFVTNVGYRGLGEAQLRWMWTTTLMGHWVPLTWMSLGLNYVLGGMEPWGYHAGNVLLHAANAVLLYFLTRRLYEARRVR